MPKGLHLHFTTKTTSTETVPKEQAAEAVEPLALPTGNELLFPFIQLMDIRQADAFLDNNRTYNDLEKTVFLQKLDAAFEQFKTSGDTFLKAFKGMCNGKKCNRGCAGFTFIGNHSGNYFDMVVEEQDGAVLDIQECAFFLSFHPGHKKTSRIMISDEKIAF